MPVAIDANALDRDGNARDNLVDRLLRLSSAGTINLIVSKRVRKKSKTLELRLMFKRRRCRNFSLSRSD
jgi:hypothetical protein